MPLAGRNRTWQPKEATVNFNLDLVLAELADLGPTARYRHDSRLDLDRVEVLGPLSIPRTGSLFVADVASFGALDDVFATAGSFLVLGADAPPEEADEADTPPVLYVPAGPGLPAPAEMLARLLEMRLRLDAWSETLLTAMARDASLQEVFDIAAEQFANPLMLSDATLYFVLVAGRLPEDVGYRNGRVPHRAVHGGVGSGLVRPWRAGPSVPHGERHRRRA